MNTDDQHPIWPDEQLHLAELVNRVLDRGAVISGEVTISVAGIDLVYLGLHIVLASTETVKFRPGFNRFIR
jgi:gas vesicle structural protein